MINNNYVFAINIDNSVKPVSYFINHVQQLNEVKNNLQKYGKASLVEFSGVGKTQIARMYVYDYRDKYKIIWFFDCSLDLNNQFHTLAELINKYEGKTIFSDNKKNIKREVMEYFSNKKEWLFIFDNLVMGQNHKIEEFVKWDNNGHIIFCSQEKNILPHIIDEIKFKAEDSYDLAISILADNKKQFAEFITEKFKDQPGLVVLASQVVNNFHGLSLAEYKKLIIDDANYIENTLRLAQKQLSPKALNLLNIISLINNQSFSKQFLNIIQGTDVSDELIQLSKLMLITYLKNDNIDNPVYEMHDIFSYKIQKVNGRKRNEEILINIIDRVTNVLPKYMLKDYIIFSGNTFQSNIEAMLKNAEDNKVNLYKVMQIYQLLLCYYVSSHNYYDAKKMVMWFLQKEDQLNIKTMNEKEHRIYADCIQCVGGYYRLALSDNEKAIEYFLKAIKLINKYYDKNEGMYFSLLYQLAQCNLSIGNINYAKENIDKMEFLLMSGKNINEVGLIHLVKAKLLYLQGNYNDALLQVNKDISESIKYGLLLDDLLFTSTYLLKLEILNALKQNNKAYRQAQQLLDMYKLKSEQHSIFGRLYIQMAITKLNDKRTTEAKQYMEKAMPILLENTNINNRDLALGYITQGDISLIDNKPRISIDFYLKALDIYINLYGRNKNHILEVSNLYVKGAKTACAIKDRSYNIFGKLQIDDFGIDHYNTKEMLNYCRSYNVELNEYTKVPN